MSTMSKNAIPIQHYVDVELNIFSFEWKYTVQIMQMIRVSLWVVWFDWGVSKTKSADP